MFESGLMPVLDNPKLHENINAECFKPFLQPITEFLGCQLKKSAWVHVQVSSVQFFFQRVFTVHTRRPQSVGSCADKREVILQMRVLELFVAKKNVEFRKLALRI